MGMSEDKGVDQAAPELLPCPFCGGESHVGTIRYSKPLEDAAWHDGSEITECFFVNCASCGVSNQGLIAGYRTTEEAIAAWNRRAAPSAPADEHVCALNRVKGGHCIVCGSVDAAMQAEKQAKDEYHQAIADFNRMTDRVEVKDPSAPAKVEWLDYAAIDAIRLEAFRTNDPTTKQRFLEYAGRWFQYETDRALDRYDALTAMQAENERLRARVKELECVLTDMASSHDAAFEASAHNEARAEKAEAVADQLAKCIESYCEDFGSTEEDEEALAAHAKLKGDV